MTDQTSKEWVTHECHRVFDDEYQRHVVMIKETIRQTMKEELHPRHGEHHIIYDGDLGMRNSVKHGLAGSIGGMAAQAIIIGLLISAAMFLRGAL